MKVVYVETINEELPEKSWGADSKFKVEYQKIAFRLCFLHSSPRLLPSYQKETEKEN